MHRNRRPRRSSARPVFALPLLLALLSLVFLPAIAHAEEEGSAGIIYGSETPTATGSSKPPPIPKLPGTNNEGGKAKQSTAEGNSEPENTEVAPESESESESESKNPPAASGGNSNNDGNGGHHNVGNGQPGGKNKAQTGETGVSKSQPVAHASSSAPSDSGGGSSPVVPILIVVVVLAAISIGVVIYRQRRQGSGSPVSPKAS